VILEQIGTFRPDWIKSRKPGEKEHGQRIYDRYWPRMAEIQKERDRKLGHMKRGDELPNGVLEMVKVYVATKRSLAVGDKMAGRHGNKGVIARIMAEQDMPFLADGTPVDICLNPLGVPSRMNVGQILETHLGWAAGVLGFQAITPVFDGAGEEEIFQVVGEANEHVRKRTYFYRVKEKESLATGADALGVSINERDFPGTPDEILTHIGKFGAKSPEYRQTDDAKKLDAQICEALRRTFYSERFLSTYTFVPTRDSFTKADLEAVEHALIAKYKSPFNRAKTQTEAARLDPKQEEVYEQCKQRIEADKWFDAPKLCSEESKGLYFFRNRTGDVQLQYVGIAGGKDGLKGRLKDHFSSSQNSYGDNLVKRFAERLQVLMAARAARSELQEVDSGVYASSLAAIQDAGHSRELLVEMPLDGKIRVYDGRTGEPFDQRVTVGYIYMNKLHHLVDDKIHARSTGPYSLITQQPLGGKARTGGQRFGEMEVWGLEAYGASYTLQELLTVKSDDVEGRTKIYESMVKGNNTLEAGTPVSFDVLCNEVRGLGLNIQLEKKRSF